MKRALVPGTFDPITEGHLDIVRRASQIFDEVIISIAESPDKGGHARLFTLEERVRLAKESTADLPNVRVESFGDLLVNFARRMDAKVIVKGLRAITDFEYEFQMTAMNYEIDREIETVFIMSPPKYMYLSSSIVREIARLNGPFKEFVSAPVFHALCGKYGLNEADVPAAAQSAAQRADV